MIFQCCSMTPGPKIRNFMIAGRLCSKFSIEFENESVKNGGDRFFQENLPILRLHCFTFKGLIGALMVQRGVVVDGKVFAVERADEVYPALVKAVMPKWALGFFAAVLLGSVLSSFNSALNSSSTIFGLEIYKIYVSWFINSRVKKVLKNRS